MKSFAPPPGGPIPAFKLTGNQSRLSRVSDAAGTIQLSTDNNGYFQLTSSGSLLMGRVADAPGAVANKIDTWNNHVEEGVRLLSIQNDGVEKAFIDLDGNASIAHLTLNEIGGANAASIEQRDSRELRIITSSGRIVLNPRLGDEFAPNRVLIGDYDNNDVLPENYRTSLRFTHSGNDMGGIGVTNTASPYLSIVDICGRGQDRDYRFISDSRTADRVYALAFGPFSDNGLGWGITPDIWGSGRLFSASTLLAPLTLQSESGDLVLEAARSTVTAAKLVVGADGTLKVYNGLTLVQDLIGDSTFSTVTAGTFYGRPANTLGFYSYLDPVASPGSVGFLFSSNYVWGGASSPMFVFQDDTQSWLHLTPDASYNAVISNPAAAGNLTLRSTGAAVILESGITPTVTAIGTIITTTQTFTANGEKLVSFRNNGVEVAHVRHDGGYSTLGVSQPHGGLQIAAGGVYNDGYSWLMYDYLSLIGSLAGGQLQTTLQMGRLYTVYTDLEVRAGGNTDLGRVLTLVGSMAAGAAGADVIIASDQIRTAGKILSIKNNAVEQAYITPEGSYITAVGLWDDVQCAVNEAGGAAALTVEAYRDSVFQGRFLRHDQDDTLFLTWQMPHGWDPTTSVKPHVHITPMVNPAADQVVRFTGKYVWTQVGVAVPADASWIAFTVDHTVGTADEFKPIVVPLATVAPPANPKESNILMLWLRRPGSSDAADTYTTAKALGTAQANVLVVSIDAHYQKVKSGTVGEIP